jgi:hypothetical protein
MQLTAIDQVQKLLLDPAPLAGSVSATSVVIDMDEAESFGISSFIERDAADTNMDLKIEHSYNNTPAGPWRELDLVNLSVTAAAPENSYDAVYAVTRRYYRVTWENKTANGLLIAEVGFVKKPLS